MIEPEETAVRAAMLDIPVEVFEKQCVTDEQLDLTADEKPQCLQYPPMTPDFGEYFYLFLFQVQLTFTFHFLSKLHFDLNP